MTQPVDVGLQQERTALSWERTGLSLAAAALGVGRHALHERGLFVVVPCGLVLLCAAWVLLESSRRTRTPRRDGFAVLGDGRVVAVVAALAGLLCAVEAVALVVRP